MQSLLGSPRIHSSRTDTSSRPRDRRRSIVAPTRAGCGRESGRRRKPWAGKIPIRRHQVRVLLILSAKCETYPDTGVR